MMSQEAWSAARATGRRRARRAREAVPKPKRSDSVRWGKAISRGDVASATGFCGVGKTLPASKPDNRSRVKGNAGVNRLSCCCREVSSSTMRGPGEIQCLALGHVMLHAQICRLHEC